MDQAATRSVEPPAGARTSRTIPYTAARVARRNVGMTLYTTIITTTTSTYRNNNDNLYFTIGGNKGVKIKEIKKYDMTICVTYLYLAREARQFSWMKKIKKKMIRRYKIIYRMADCYAVGTRSLNTRQIVYRYVSRNDNLYFTRTYSIKK